MKKNTILSASLVLGLFGAVTFQPSTAASPAPSAAVVQNVTDVGSFMIAVRKHMSIGATNEIGKLIRKHQEIATWAIIAECEAYSTQPSERLDDEIEALRQGWNKSIKTGFVDRMYEYFALLDSGTRSERRKVVTDYQVIERQYIDARRAGDKATLISLSAAFKDVAHKLDAVGDHYYAGLACQIFAVCQDEDTRGDEANLGEAIKSYQASIAHFDKIELRDNMYEESKVRVQMLQRLGYGEEAAGPGAGPGAGPRKARSLTTNVGEPVTASFGFRSEKDIAKVVRPIWSNDSAYTAWGSLYFGKDAKEIPFPSIPEIMVNRTGPTSFSVTSNGKTTEHVMTGKIMAVEIERAGPNGSYPWSFLAVTGTKDDTYQGVTVNMEPSSQGLTVYIASGAILKGMVGETPVEIYDDTVSGAWGDEPKPWAYVGMSPGKYQQDLDSIVIDGGKKALPWSRYQQVDSKWYDLKVVGNELTAQEITLPTGKMKLKFKGPKPRYVVLQGADKLEECFFDLTSSSSVEVPVGRYRLFSGEIAKGKRTGIKKMLMLPGDNMGLFIVEEGKETLVHLGGPFEFDFEFTESDDTVTIQGESVIVVGRGGERYERPWNNRPFPLVSVRKVGQKRGSKPKKMRSQLDQDTLYSDWGLGFHPQDIELPKPKGATKVEVQLTQKKNGLFGGISSPWKP